MSKVVLAEKEIHKDKLIAMAEKIAEEYPEDLRAKETLCEVLCIFGHMEYLHNKKKDKNIDRAYELYRQIKDQTNNRFLYWLAQSIILDWAVLKAEEMEPVEREAFLIRNLKVVNREVKHDAFHAVPPSPESILILQGDADDVVPPEDTLEYAERNHIQVEWFPDTDHRYKKTGEMEHILLSARNFLLQ